MNENEHLWRMSRKLFGFRRFRCVRCRTYVITKNPASRFLSEKNCCLS